MYIYTRIICNKKKIALLFVFPIFIPIFAIGMTRHYTNIFPSNLSHFGGGDFYTYKSVNYKNNLFYKQTMIRVIVQHFVS